MESRFIFLVFLVSFAFHSKGQQWNSDPSTNSIYTGSNVGIGLAAPQGLLHITGVGNKWIYFQNNIAGGTPSNLPGLSFGWNRSGGQGESHIVYNTSAGSSPKLSFSSYNGTTFTTEMVLAGGKLAIGHHLATGPEALPGGHKLYVDGSIIAEEVVVKLRTSWPDYVFNHSYPLPSLSTLETYINTHRHLPEVPSAAEVEKNGVELGKMDALLLKKIEELTLYMIDQNKKLNALREENAALKQALEELAK